MKTTSYVLRIGLALVTLTAATPAALISNLEPTNDALVTGGNISNANAGFPNRNYGALGALMVAPPGSTKGEMQTLLKYNFAAMKTSFDTQFGAGNWAVTNVRLELGTQLFGSQGNQAANLIFNSTDAGRFKVDWLANDRWVEGTGGNTGFVPGPAQSNFVTFNSLSSLVNLSLDKTISPLNGPGTADDGFFFNANGNTNPPIVPRRTFSLGLDSSFLADITSGSNASLRLYAPSGGVSYLFNSKDFALGMTGGGTPYHPVLDVTATALPEPATALYGVACVAIACSVRRRRRACDK